MFCKRMAAIRKKGRERLEELREQHRAESERLLGVFGDVLFGGTGCHGPTRRRHRLAAGLADRRARGGGEATTSTPWSASRAISTSRSTHDS
jgi:hypothetical protein